MRNNTHVVIALIVTPLLAILGYFATDFIISEQPKRASKGGQYPLVAQPGCRHASGGCTLKNGNFKLHISGETLADDSLVITLTSDFPLQQANMSVVSNAAERKKPSALRLADPATGRWLWQTRVAEPEQQILRVAVVSEGAVYYAETGLQFLHFETSFNKDFREQ